MDYEVCNSTAGVDRPLSDQGAWSVDPLQCHVRWSRPRAMPEPGNAPGGPSP